jgi:hypothetical protein
MGKRELEDQNFFDNFWKYKVGISWTDIIKYQNFKYIIIDEVQVTYGQAQAQFFWGYLKSLLSSESYRKNIQKIHVFLIGSYRPTLDLITTPIEFKAVFGLKNLLLTKSEFQQFIKKYVELHNRIGNHGFDIPEAVQNVIFNLTGGYPGLCRFILNTLRNHFRDNVNIVEMLRFLASETLKNSILSTSRAFYWIEKWNMSVEESEFISLALQNPADHFISKVAKKSIKIGIFSIIQDDHIQFSAPILRIIMYHYLFTTSFELTKPVRFKSFDEFLKRTIERMNPKILQESLGCGKNADLYDRVWQMEWYRAASRKN